MCFLIACWEQLPSKAQVSHFIPSHSLTDTLDTVDSYPMFLTDISSHSLTTDRVATHYMLWTYIQSFVTDQIATHYALWTNIQCFQLNHLLRQCVVTNKV